MYASPKRESTGPHLHPQSNTRISLLPRKSKIHNQNQICIQCPVLQLCATCLLNEHLLTHYSRAHSNVHLIPSVNATYQKKSILNLPFSSTQSLKKSCHPFRAMNHPPSSPISPIPGDPSLRKVS